MVKDYPVVSVVVDEKGATKVKLMKGIRFSFNGKKFYIKQGFTCDGASVPRAFWRFVGHPLEGKALPAAIVHDYCYRMASVSRKDADYLFYTILRKFEVPYWKRAIMWCAVRLFGGASYGRITNAA